METAMQTAKTTIFNLRSYLGEYGPLFLLWGYQDCFFEVDPSGCSPPFQLVPVDAFMLR